MKTNFLPQLQYFDFSDIGGLAADAILPGSGEIVGDAQKAGLPVSPLDAISLFTSLFGHKDEGPSGDELKAKLGGLNPNDRMLGMLAVINQKPDTWDGKDGKEARLNEYGELFGRDTTGIAYSTILQWNAVCNKIGATKFLLAVPAQPAQPNYEFNKSNTNNGTAFVTPAQAADAGNPPPTNKNKTLYIVIGVVVVIIVGLGIFFIVKKHNK